ncbi:putative iS2 orfA [Escherichia coli 3-020-07_S3_C1]|nr:putative iS2 orfA [Escherichia coli 2-460-02_S4_C2]KDY72178.1 putative iS2 orfA [Escherichia coli 2-460-02_S4_C3]KDZ33508.1 putative iS2 orfA [Escherichia coli 3-020-07_S3_C1]KEJ41699.1 putative iS2 orfA [Escherichia coli 2-460-02_S4_C1]KEJ53680.1 putative iS2 orfA [Escherichia coli 3-020-07_S3_C2]KEK74471.1 putative iS2 orfA [Escherichia coli 3-475-03_S1_C2]
MELSPASCLSGRNNTWKELSMLLLLVKTLFLLLNWPLR